MKSRRLQQLVSKVTRIKPEHTDDYIINVNICYSVDSSSSPVVGILSYAGATARLDSRQNQFHLVDLGQRGKIFDGDSTHDGRHAFPQNDLKSCFVQFF